MTERSEETHREATEDVFAKILIAEIQREINAEILGQIKGERTPRPAPPPLPNPGVLGIIKEGEGKYRVRGHGTEDERFQNHLSGLATFTGDDWPWAYFKLNDGVTHEQLLAGFEQHYMGEDND
jgi:hypothetical protein